MTKQKPIISDTIETTSGKEQRFFRKDAWLVSKDLPSSFKYAFQGLIYNFVSQRNFRIHVFTGIIVSALAIWLNLPKYNLSIIAITIGFVLVLELINTSIEAVVDLSVGKSFNPLARIAKDSAAAAVLVSSLISVFIAVLLILPSLLDRLVS